MNHTTTPQRDLAAGILSQARRDLRRFHGSTRSTKRELYLDAYSWIVSDDCRWPYSFRNVCELLNLSPEHVRREAFREVSTGTVSYWSRRVHTALRQIHLFVREVSLRDAAKNPTLVHGLS